MISVSDGVVTLNFKTQKFLEDQINLIKVHVEYAWLHVGHMLKRSRIQLPVEPLSTDYYLDGGLRQVTHLCIYPVSNHQC